MYSRWAGWYIINFFDPRSMVSHASVCQTSTCSRVAHPRGPRKSQVKGGLHVGFRVWKKSRK